MSALNYQRRYRYAVICIEELNERIKQMQAERSLLFEQGISAAVYVVYQWKGPCEADQLARIMGYVSARTIAEKAQDDALLEAIAAHEATSKAGEEV